MNKKLLFILTFSLSFCSFSYQLLISYFYIELFNDHYFWFSFILGFYLLSFGFGSYNADKISFDKTSDELIKTEKNIISFVLCTLSLIIIGLILYFSIFSYQLYKISYLTDGDYNKFNYSLFKIMLSLKMKYKTIFSLLVLLMTSIVGYFSGKEIPLLLKMLKDKNEHILYGVSYFGILLSSLVYSYYLNLEFDKITIFFIISFINLSILAIYVIKTRKIKNIDFKKAICLFTFFSIIFFVFNKDIKNVFYQSQLKLVLKAIEIENPLNSVLDKDYYERKKTKYQLIEMIRKSNKENDIILYLNKAYQFNLSQEHWYHESMVHFSFLLRNEIPENILLIGGGDLFLLRELIKYKEIKNIDHIELDKEFLEFCSNHEIISKINNSKKVLADKRIKRRYTDAYSFVKELDEKYDFILIDIPFPSSYELSTLYSKEFYNKIYSLLSKNGSVVIDVPLYDDSYLKDNDYKNYLKSINSLVLNTLDASSFKNRKIFGNQENSIFIYLSKEKITKDHNYSLVKNKINKLNYKDFENSLQLEFNYIKDKSKVNSIFKPNFIKVESFSN